MLRFFKKIIKAIFVMSVGLLLVVILIVGLNLSALGQHRLLPQSPNSVISFEKEGEKIHLKIMDYLTPPIPFVDKIID